MTPRSIALFRHFSQHVLTTGHKLKWVDGDPHLRCPECLLYGGSWEGNYLQDESAVFRDLLTRQDPKLLLYLNSGRIREFFTEFFTEVSVESQEMLSAILRDEGYGEEVIFGKTEGYCSYATFSLYCSYTTFNHRYQCCLDNLEEPAWFLALLGKGLPFGEFKSRVPFLRDQRKIRSRFARVL